MIEFTLLPSADDRFTCCVQILTQVDYNYLVWKTDLWDECNTEQQLLFFSTQERFDVFAGLVQ